MHFFKKNLKVIIGFILGVILASEITIYAYSYLSGDIKYTKKNGTEISVENALNELYDKYDKLVLKLETFDYATTLATSKYIFTDDIANKYSYFKISNVVANTSVTHSALRGFSNDTNSNVTLTENQVYNISDYSSIWVNIQGNGGILSYDLLLSN